MTKQEILKEIRKLNLIEKEIDSNYGYEIYEDDNSGALFEIDYDGNKIIHIYEISSDCGEIIDVLF